MTAAPPPVVRRFKLRARHLRPLAPAWVRDLMARRHAAARRRIAAEIGGLPPRGLGALSEGRASGLLRLVRAAEHHRYANVLWESGAVMPDPWSDDPAARGGHDRMSAVAELVWDADAAHPPDGGRAVKAIVNMEPVRFRDRGGDTVYRAVWDARAAAYAAAGEAEPARPVRLEPGVFVHLIAWGRWVPILEGERPAPAA